MVEIWAPCQEEIASWMLVFCGIPWCSATHESGTIQSLGYSFYAKLKAQAFWKEVDFGYLQLPGVCNLSLGYILKIQDGAPLPFESCSCTMGPWGIL